MKKLKNRSGFSLIEMLLALGIMVLMIVGMGSGLNAGVKAYSKSIFESNSAALAGILNSAVSDVLRFGENVTRNPQYGDEKSQGFHKKTDDTYLTKNQVDFVFTNYEYRARNAYLVLGTHKNKDGIETSTAQILKIANLDDKTELELVNTGAYPDLTIQDFEVKFYPPQAGSESGNYFTVSYKIVDMKENTNTRSVETNIHLMNPEE